MSNFSIIFLYVGLSFRLQKAQRASLLMNVSLFLFRIEDVDSEGEGDSTLATSLTARQNLEGMTKITFFLFSRIFIFVGNSMDVSSMLHMVHNGNRGISPTRNCTHEI